MDSRNPTNQLEPGCSDRGYVCSRPGYEAGCWRDPRVALGERVNALRVALGLSQEDFAAQVGLDRTYVSGIERGLRNPTLLVLLRLAQALEVPVTELLEEPPPRQKGERPPANR
ncbi:MAG: XRE family transcriptional regulator [Azospirillum brasilense]|jgi:DNA-binding XRE family transcriptional regulator|nr:helix-turn-helix transcriptional regulator [Roseomonas mucosa]PZR07485.1 MAG: XRE family transcriptional regulator [Azospirillum brasilense]QET91413.1 helix-turn-helix transcriptional regulator [Roseomonas mucosa]